MHAPKGRLDVAAGEETSHILSGLTAQLPDRDPEETAEWIESLDALIAEQGTERAQYIMRSLLQRAGARSVGVPMVTTTDYVNTIPVDQEAPFPGNEEFERRYRAYMRWNAAVMVHRAQRSDIGVGGHISTYAGAATLYEVGFNHFFRGKDHPSGGDQVFFQGHASPGMYARAFMEGRLTEEDLDGFRQEKSKEGHALSSYPHPRLMPDFWEFPTVSMGIGPMNAIYQAQSNRYLQNRGIKDTSDQQVWAFLGDGEMDEPESRGLLQLAANENLDNLNFVINCNLQRLDGPVRGNGKIMQELEAFFRGAGWNVIKVVWGREWDTLLENDADGALVKIMNETPDGDYQTYKAESGGFVREHFFGKSPQTKDMVADLDDEQIWGLKRGGHDYRKVYAAYKAATEFKGKPTVILAKTVKGYGLGPHFEGRNATHQMKKLTMEDLKAFRDHLRIPISDDQLDADLYRPPYYHPGMDAPEIKYLMERRAELGGFLPERRRNHTEVVLPDAKSYEVAKRGSGKQQAATTMAFVRLLKDLMRDKNFGARFVPVVPDESRTFGMDAFFPTAKIYNPKGQNYLSVDRDLVLAYKESPAGQLIHPGINEAGAVAAFTAAGTSYATHGEPLIPIYVFYSMFGFQRTGDSFWAAADQMTRGFIIGATAGRTTLTGEGLQHADGHSPLLASTNPAVKTYDPAYGYEIGHIIRHGLEQMYGENSDRPECHVLPHRLQRTHHPTRGTGKPRHQRTPQRHLPPRRSPAHREQRKQREPAHREHPRLRRLRALGPRSSPDPERRLERRRHRVVRDLLERTPTRRTRRRRTRLPQPRPTRPHPVHHRTTRKHHRTRHRRVRLHESRPRPNPPIHPQRLRLPRSRRLRLLRHPPSRTPLLQKRHPLHRRQNPPTPRRQGRS